MATQQLIPVFSGTIQNEPTQMVDARALHQSLGIARDFSTWLKKRIADYGFTLNQDYIQVIDSSAPQNGGAPKSISYGDGKIDYHLTLGMAKELAMVERNEKGRQIRRYFIECERRAHGGATATSAHTAPPSEPEMSVILQAALSYEAHQIASESYDGILAELTERARHYLRTGIPEADILDCLKRKGFGRASMVHPQDLKPLLDQAKAMFNSLNDLVEGGSELYAMRLR